MFEKTVKNTTSLMLIHELVAILQLLPWTIFSLVNIKYRGGIDLTRNNVVNKNDVIPYVVFFVYSYSNNTFFVHG